MYCKLNHVDTYLFPFKPIKLFSIFSLVAQALLTLYAHKYVIVCLIAIFLKMPECTAELHMNESSVDSDRWLQMLLLSCSFAALTAQPARQEVNCQYCQDQYYLDIFLCFYVLKAPMCRIWETSDFSWKTVCTKHTYIPSPFSLQITPRKRWVNGLKVHAPVITRIVSTVYK